MSENGNGAHQNKMMPTALERRRYQTQKPDERADWIGQELRKVFDETVNEPLPDRLQMLLNQLRKEEDQT
jgi:hypothetical protein